jgi:hypothetical protein
LNAAVKLAKKLIVCLFENIRHIEILPRQRYSPFVPAKLGSRLKAVKKGFVARPLSVFAFDFKGIGLKIVTNFHTFHL